MPGYMLCGDYRRPNLPAAIVNTVADGVWDSVRAYFAPRAAVPLRLEPIADDTTWKMA